MNDDLRDISARMAKVREKKQPNARDDRAAAFDHAQSYLIRARMIGVLMRDARKSAGRALEDCAHLLRVSPEQFEAWELGDDVPSLPQLELLAYYLDVPVSHFWGSSTLESDHDRAADAQTEYMALRDRMIGALLRQAREGLGMSLDDLSEASGLPVEQIAAYEFGELTLPMHELTVLASTVKKSMSYFLETSSHIGELLALREQWKHFTELPEDLRSFASNPLNLGFIEIALMLSQMPTDRLRRVGESVLNITL